MTVDERDQVTCFQLEETGEYTKMENVTLENIESIFKEDEVFLIMYPPVRRIYIWKGRKAPVQKKFISSRVAQKLQRESVRNAGMQHKIVSIDQGDELDEFIKNLGLKGIKTEAERKAEQKKREEEEARRFEELMKQPDIVKEPASKDKDVVRASSHLAKFMKSVAEKQVNVGGVSGVQAPGVVPARMSDKDKQEILDKMLKEPIPDGYQREHLILDEDLYVNVKKIGQVFDKDIEIETWDVMRDALQDGMVEIGERKIRLLVANGKIKAVEFFKKKQPAPRQQDVSGEAGTSNGNAS